MNKKLIRLTESDLHRIVKESVNRILNEIGDTPKGQLALGAVAGRANVRGNRDTEIAASNKAWDRSMSTNPYMNRHYDSGYELGKDMEHDKQLKQRLASRLKESVDEFEYSDSEDLGRGKHRQVIIYNGKEIGYLLYIEKNWLAPVEEKYILPDIEYGMSEPTDSMLDGKKGWIDFKVFDNYEEAFAYARQNFEQLAYLFEYGDYD